MGMSFSHLLIVLIIILVLFGAGKLPQVMADLGKGLKAFKDSMQNNQDSSSSDSAAVSKPQNKENDQNSPHN